MNDFHDLSLVLRSRFPIITVDSQEEARLLALFERACGQEQWPLYRWSVADGLCRCAGAPADPAQEGPETRELETTLRIVDRALSVGVYLLFDAQAFLQSPANLRLVKQIALAYDKRPRTLVFVGHRVELPEELRRLSARFELSLPDLAQLKQILREEADAWNRGPQLDRLRGEPEAAQQLLQQLLGCSAEDARRRIRHAIRDDGMLNRDDVRRLLLARQELLGGGALNLELDAGSFGEVAGLDNLKRWLERRGPVFRDSTSKLDAPRGVLLLGVQGSGKSMACKAIAGAWGLPLLRLDFGALYSKWIGETERNLREAFRSAESLAPCVLWLDEIEKGLGPEGEDQGVGRRVLGALLTWMSERKARVFLAATANDISALPPELLRKGRFDEIFFVDLPDAATRETIFRIHLQRRGIDPARLDLPPLAVAAEGFSGAEIEQAVVGATYEAAAQQQPLSNTMLRDELARTRPLSVVMAERIAELRDWAASRTVPA
ncbi:MAG TPA: AAA family ATPase [Solimonas sp.]|nr:AAA family ATPase [Solimonas sp.]